MDIVASDNDDHVFAKFGFCNFGGQNGFDLRNMLLIKINPL